MEIVSKRFRKIPIPKLSYGIDLLIIQYSACEIHNLTELMQKKHGAAYGNTLLKNTMIENYDVNSINSSMIGSAFVNLIRFISTYRSTSHLILSCLESFSYLISGFDFLRLAPASSAPRSATFFSTPSGSLALSSLLSSSLSSFFLSISFALSLQSWSIFYSSFLIFLLQYNNFMQGQSALANPASKMIIYNSNCQRSLKGSSVQNAMINAGNNLFRDQKMNFIVA